MSQYTTSYILCNKYYPYYEKNSRSEFQGIWTPFHTERDGELGNPIHYLKPYGVLIKTDKRHCLHQFYDRNGNLCVTYYTSGNTECKTVSTDPNATLCQDKYNQIPKIPDSMTKNFVVTDNGQGYYTEGDGFIISYFTGANKKLVTSNYAIDNLSLDLSSIEFKVKLDVETLWNNSNTTVDNTGFARYANYVARNDLWYDSGLPINGGLWNRFKNAITTPNWVNGEFVNTNFTHSIKNGLEFMGLNVDLLDGNSNNDSSNTDWRFQDIHAQDFYLADKYTIKVSEFPVLDTSFESPDNTPIRTEIDDIREFANVKTNVISYNIPVCHTIEEVRDWLDNGILPDGWNQDDEDIDTDGESEPNENDSIEDNQGTTPSNLSLQGIDLYLVDSTDIATFKNAFFDFDLTNSVINKFTGLYSGLENYVVGLKYYPCGLPPLSTGISTVKVGNLQLEDNGNAITLNRINGYQSSVLYSGTLQLPEYYHSILDYGGYNKAWLYLPYYGTVPIDVSILRTRTLKVVYTLDILSGSATIILYIGNSGGYTPMNIYSCEMGCDIPMTLQSGIELGTKVVDLSTNVLTATIGGATGGAVGAIAGGVQNVTNGVDLSNMTQVCGRSNSLAMQGAPLYPSLLLMKPKYPKNYQGSYGNLVGKPSCTTSRLSSGYNKLLNGKPNIKGCTQSEYDEIVSLLNEGVWI